MLTTKLLPVFVYPLGLALVLTLAALIVRRWLPKTATWAAFLGLLVLWIASTPVVANWVTLQLESAYPPVEASALPTVDAVVVLGGILGQPLPPRIEPDLGEAADRIFAAAKIFHAGKAKFVLVSGGNLPWDAAVRPEAEFVEDYLAALGVPREAMIAEGESRDTHENAVNSAAIFAARGFKSGILVTSAAHMKRAMATFARAGLALTPAPTDLRARLPLADSILDFLPNAGALAQSSDAMKEWIGLLVYRLRGWA